MIPKIESPKTVPKGWGREIHIHNADGYCGKLLIFNGEGSKTSLHYHVKKTETWFFNGPFTVVLVDPKTAIRETLNSKSGDVLHIPAGIAHQLVAIGPMCSVFEVSTPDDPDDSYRVEAGDSQKQLPDGVDAVEGEPSSCVRCGNPSAYLVCPKCWNAGP